jgi:hypothetical protein
MEIQVKEMHIMERKGMAMAWKGKEMQGMEVLAPPFLFSD